MPTPDRSDKLNWDDLAPAFFKWGLYYCKLFPKYDEWELINSVWAMGYVQKLKDIRLASARIQWDMLDYIRKQHGVRAKKEPTRDAKNQHRFDQLEERDRHNMLPCEDVDDSEMFDFIVDIIQKANIGRLAEDVIIRRYFGGYTMKETADDLGFSPSYISQIEKTALVEMRHAVNLFNISQ